ncbi:MAG: polysaccharide biosynthesis/export family protein [Gemmatimonadaceae bacterium]
MLKHIARSRALLAVLLTLSAACASGRAPVELRPLPDHPWTVLVGDEVRVRVYREPDLSGQFLVNTQGVIQLPGLGKLPVVGLSVDSLTTVITAMYARRVVNAIVDVGIVRMLPMLGDVKSPGVYAAEPTWTVQQALARAGGLQNNRRDVQVFLRKGRDQSEYRLSIDWRLDRLPLEDGDALVFVDPSFAARNAGAMDLFTRGATLAMLVTQLILLGKK